MEQHLVVLDKYTTAYNKFKIIDYFFQKCREMGRFHPKKNLKCQY